MMQTEFTPISAAPGSSAEAELYLHTVEELSRQLEQAMDAVVARSLPAFQDSLCRQREACSQLLALPRYLEAESEWSAISHPGVDVDLITRITAAGNALRTLNRRYSALLGHTGDTMKLLARLLGGYRTPAMPIAAGQTNRSTWSCEV